MNKVKIITDSTCDMGADLAKKYDVEVLPLYVNFTDESFKDGVNISTEELYKLVEKKNELPKTAAIDIVTLEETFKKWLDQGYDIIFTGISKSMSRTYENAVMAKDELEANNIYRPEAIYKDLCQVFADAGCLAAKKKLGLNVDKTPEEK